MGAWVYILRCAYSSYYTGSTRSELERQIAEHQAGRFPGFTEKRRPVVLVYSEYFEQIVDAIAAERKIKGWSRAKKEALMAADFARISQIGPASYTRSTSWFETRGFAALLTMRSVRRHEQ